MATARTISTHPVLPPLDHNEDDPTLRRYRHLDRCRRVMIGSLVHVVFEDKHTLWFRMQELARYARTVGRAAHRQMEWYKRLMPGNGRLTAAVSVGAPGCRPSAHHADVRRSVSHGKLYFQSEFGGRIVGDFLHERVTDSLIGMIGWIEFQFSQDERIALADPKQKWILATESDVYCDESEPLSKAVRLSLASNLA